MSNYTKATDFAAKDALPSGDPSKVITGTAHDDEYNAIATAINSKADTAGPTLTGTTTVTTLAVTDTVDGRDVAADGTKLDGIEDNATADQTGAQIKSAYEGESDTNAFTDADHSKLDGIEAGATTDQSNSDIKTAYEANSNTNAYTDTEQTKLAGIDTSANNYTHPTHAGDDFDIDSGALTGATVISDLDINLTTDTSGHTVDANATIATRVLALSDLGSVVSQAEAEAGTATTERTWTAQRVSQSVVANSPTSTATLHAVALYF